MRWKGEVGQSKQGERLGHWKCSRWRGGKEEMLTQGEAG